MISPQLDLGDSGNGKWADAEHVLRHVPLPWHGPHRRGAGMQGTVSESEQPLVAPVICRKA
ncbi:hypothetical protein [Acrocarpospora pleiomorpha]|uniref:hypothetical protein n=1 Tax=Acrocarpospora pleiomorpha TaxID=90975 RepID=UPI0012D33CF4|nr:hypothetical protein [Acrocarpospora pleiomorpha]